MAYISKFVTAINNELKNTFNIYYNNHIVIEDAEKYAIFEDKVLAIAKDNYLYVYDISKNFLELRSILRKDGIFENALVFIDEVRYIINFNCIITCCGRC